MLNSKKITVDSKKFNKRPYMLYEIKMKF